MKIILDRDNGISATMIADSISSVGKRITTMELHYPRFILAQLNTHRSMSRNTSSSRAIPVANLIAQVAEKPVMPVHFGENQAGMEAKNDEVNTDWARSWWLNAAMSATIYAREALDNNLHKQIANRVLEPFMFVNTLVTATEWDNFFHLRLNHDAQPEIQDLARCMRTCMNKSIPELNDKWHLPYVSKTEIEQIGLEDAKKVSVARCCRVSYNKHGNLSDIFDDIIRHDVLMESGHWSPFEHVAVAMNNQDIRSGNFNGWHQYRNILQDVQPVITSNLDYKRHLI